ncbi:hypothetical protein Tco_1317978 [Tanacetum coccineum]
MSSNTSDYIYSIIVPSDVDVEDAFSSTTTPNYTPASPDYSPASPGNTSLNPSDDLSKYLLASLAISPFHDDPYMKMNSLERIEHIEDIIEGLGNGRVVIQQGFDHLETELHEARAQIAGFQKEQTRHDDEIVLARVRVSTLEMIIEDIQLLLESNHWIMDPKRTSTSTAPATTQAAIRKLVADSTKGAVGLICWFERTESVFSYSNCTEDCKVKFATGTLIEEALSVEISFASYWNRESLQDY